MKEDWHFELARRYVEGTATGEETRTLEGILRADPEFRRQFLRYTHMDAALARSRRLVPTPVVEAAPNNIVRVRFADSWKMLLAAAACLMLMLTGLNVMRRDTGWAIVVEAGQGVEIVRNARKTPALAGDRLRRNDAIHAGESGQARLAVKSLGTVVLGPEASLERGGEDRLLKLHSGFIEILAEKQPADKPWRIRTPQAEAAVIGTQFNIASAEGRTALRVREGLVRLTGLQSGKMEAVGGGTRAFVTSAAPPSIGSSRPGSVLFLTTRESRDSNWDRFNRLIGDRLVGARLWRLGFMVETKHYDEVQPEDLRDRALVIVSVFGYGVGEPALERIKLADAPVPVLCLEPAAYPVLGMTLAMEGQGFGFLENLAGVEITMPGHPLAEGMRGAGVPGRWFKKIGAWGRPAPAAQVVAHLTGHSDQAVFFVYDAAARMAAAPGGDARQAPARRAGLFLDPYAMTEANNAVWQVLEAAVDWSVSLETAR